jgi:hypothetical protein
MRRKGGIPNPSSRDLMAALRSKPINKRTREVPFP